MSDAVLIGVIDICFLFIFLIVNDLSFEINLLTLIGIISKGVFGWGFGSFFSIALKLTSLIRI